MAQIYSRKDAESMTFHPNVATLGSQLVLMDTLDEPLVLPKDEERRFTYNPVQFVSTMTLLVCFHGRIELNIGLEPHELHAGDALFLKSGIIAEMTYMTPDVRFISVIVSEGFYIPIFTGVDISAIQRSLIHQPICRLPEASLQECEKIYRLMKAKALEESGLQFKDDIVKGHLQALLFTVYAIYDRQAHQHRDDERRFTRQQEIFSRFMELVQRDFRKERNIKYYADRLCITPTYLSRIVLQESGHPAGDHIDNFVITEAKQLVRSRQYTILQVSEMLNFTCQSFFGRWFKKHTGYSPTEYQGMG